MCDSASTGCFFSSSKKVPTVQQSNSSINSDNIFFFTLYVYRQYLILIGPEIWHNLTCYRIGSLLIRVAANRSFLPQSQFHLSFGGAFIYDLIIMINDRRTMNQSCSGHRRTQHFFLSLLVFIRCIGICFVTLVFRYRCTIKTLKRLQSDKFSAT